MISGKHPKRLQELAFVLSNIYTPVLQDDLCQVPEFYTALKELMELGTEMELGSYIPMQMRIDIIEPIE